MTDPTPNLFVAATAAVSGFLKSLGASALVIMLTVSFVSVIAAFFFWSLWLLRAALRLWVS